MCGGVTISLLLFQLFFILKFLVLLLILEIESDSPRRLFFGTIHGCLQVACSPCRQAVNGVQTLVRVETKMASVIREQVFW